MVISFFNCKERIFYQTKKYKKINLVYYIDITASKRWQFMKEGDRNFKRTNDKDPNFIYKSKIQSTR